MADRAVYLLSVFFNEVNRTELAKIPPVLNALAGGDHIAIEYDSHRAAFAFVSDKDTREIARAMSGLPSENLRFMVLRVDGAVTGSVSRKVADWFRQRLANSDLSAIKSE